MISELCKMKNTQFYLYTFNENGIMFMFSCNLKCQRYEGM